MAPATHGATECQLRDSRRAEKQREGGGGGVGGLGNSVIDARYKGGIKGVLERRGEGEEGGNMAEHPIHSFAGPGIKDGTG